MRPLAGVNCTLLKGNRMAGSIYLIDEQQKLVEMRESEYDSESVLQKLLAEYPNLLAGAQIDPDQPRRWLLVSREVGVPSEEGATGRWSLDHLFLDQDAIPTLVEVKRSTDTRIRREVVGQMLDYAANAVVHWPIERIISLFERRCEDSGSDPQELLDELLESEQSAEDFWNDVKTNLKAGRVRLVFVADVIPTELRRITEFLGEQMDPAEVFAVEVRQYEGEGRKTLVPRMIGTPKSKPVVVPGEGWTRESLLDHIEKQHGPQAGAVAKRLIEWWYAKGLNADYSTSVRTGFIPWLEHGGVNHYPFTIQAIAILRIQFSRMRRRPPFDRVEVRQELLTRLNSIEGIDLPPTAIDGAPKIQLAALADGDRSARFIETFEWFLTTLRGEPRPEG